MLKQARIIAEEAAAIALEGFRKGGAIEKKGRIDLLTEYDLAAEKCIRARLAKSFPGHHVVGEEGDAAEHALRDERPVWYVDPIDGTTNFAHGHPFFCVSMSLVHHDVIQLGVVVAPALGIVWEGERGAGARRNDVPCKVSTRASLEDALCATGFPYDRWTHEDDNTAEHAAFLKCTRGIRRCGSAAIDLCLVADGTYDIYWEQRLNPWDLCGGALLVEEAGGRLTDYDGSTADARTGRLVATNGVLHDAALGVLERVRAR